MRKNAAQIAQERQAVVAEAMSWLRTPYHHLQRVKAAGVDCAQILVAVYSAVGIVEEFETGHYPSDWMMHREEERYLGFIEQYAHRVADPLPGDIVLYKFGRCVSHGGIVVEWPLIIHAYAPERQVTYGEGNMGALAKRLFGFYSVWGNDVGR